MVCYMKDSCFFSVIISTHKVKIRFFCHIGSWNRNIFITGNIYTCTVIMFIIYTCGNREFGYITFTMIHNCMYIRWENRLCIIIYRNCRICPPEKSLCHWSTIVQLSTDFNICLVRIQCKACNSFCSVHLVYIIDHNCFTSIFMFCNCIVYRLISSRTVMLRPVKFNTTGNPRSCQTYQRWFNYMVIIYKIISICFIICSLDSATQFRKYHHFKILILQINCLPCLIFFDIFNLLYHRIRIYSS